MPKSIPEKLKHDAIIEAVFEIRFAADQIPEILYGRLADHPGWKNLEQKRLPAYEIPASLRQADENLRYQPLWELHSRDTSVRIGPQVLSYHQRAYPGWAAFEPMLTEVVELLFQKAEKVSINRLGIRYINALRPSMHGISGINDMDMSISIDQRHLESEFNLNFSNKVDDHTSYTVRIASPEFVQGDLPKDTSIYVDIDV